MSAPAGNETAALLAADTFFESGYLDKVLEGPDSMLVGLLSTDINEAAAAVEIDVAMGNPQLQVWRGARQASMLRRIAMLIRNEPYHKTVRIDAVAMKTNRTGAILRAINRLFDTINADLEKLIVDSMFANTALGADGQPFFAAAHPYSSSSGNNITTSALSFSVMDAARQAMANFKDEDGRLLDISPTHLICSKALEKTAREITSADRVVALDNSGAESGTRVAAATRSNVFAGELTVISTPRLVGTQYAFLDLSKGDKPVLRSVAEELHPAKQDREDDYFRYINNQYLYGVEGIMGFGPGPWQIGYGRVTTS